MVICLSLLFNSVSKLCPMYKKYFKNLSDNIESIAGLSSREV